MQKEAWAPSWNSTKVTEHFSNFSSFSNINTSHKPCPLRFQNLFIYWKRIKEKTKTITELLFAPFHISQNLNNIAFYLQWSAAKTQMHHWAYLVMNQFCWMGTRRTITPQAWMFIQPLNFTLLRAPAPVRIMWELSTWMVLCPSLTR